MYTIPKKLMKDNVVHMERLRRRWRLSQNPIAKFSAGGNHSATERYFFPSLYIPSFPGATKIRAPRPFLDILTNMSKIFALFLCIQTPSDCRFHLKKHPGAKQLRGVPKNSFHLPKASTSSLPSLFATAMAATESPTQFREVTSISMGRLMARIRE